MSERIAFAGPFYGEWGWEIMTWQAYLRRKSRDVDKMWITTFPGMDDLYTGFHCPVMFSPHNHPGRALEWRDKSLCQYWLPEEATVEIDPIKKYRLDDDEAEFVRYGTPRNREIEVLFHARNIPKGSFKNYPLDRWVDIANHFPKSASVGAEPDLHIPGTVDKRGILLADLMDLMAGARVVVGQSSGVMHLASLCGTRQVVWGDSKTHFNELLEVRYKQTWNPLGTPVTWVESDDWKPPAEKVISGILGGADEHRPGQKMLSALKAGFESGKHLMANAYISSDGKIIATWETQGFPRGDLIKAVEQLKADLIEEENLTAVDEAPKEEGGAELWR